MADMTPAAHAATAWERMRDAIDRLPSRQRIEAWSEIARRVAVQLARNVEAETNNHTTEAAAAATGSPQ